MRELNSESERRRKLEDVEALVAKGLGVEDPHRLDVRGDLTFGSNVKVEINVVFKGKVSLGNDVSIGVSCIIEDSVIEDGVQVRDFSSVTSSRVAAGAQIGPYARLRPGSNIGASTQIGNFVETKEVTTGTGCKINHHSFVGNATLGDGVVIGAGSITCNHDGKGINHTVIESNAYVGSGVMLIAPVRVGESAVIAAGSNITSDVPPHTLAISRTKEIVLKPLRR